MHLAALVGGEHPGARRAAGGVAVYVVEVLHLELRARKRAVALGGLLAGVGVQLHQHQVELVGLGRVDHGAAVDLGGLVCLHGDLVDGAVNGVALGRLGLLHVGLADGHLVEPAVAGPVGRDGADRARAGRVGVHRVDCALQAVAAVAVGDRLDGGRLVDAYRPVGVVAEAQHVLGAASRVHQEGVETAAHLGGVGLYLAQRGAEELATGPVAEVGAGAVGGRVEASLVDVAQEHVARAQVLGGSHAAAVVPGAWPHGLVEARGTVGEPQCRDQGRVVHRVLLVAAFRRRCGSGVHAVGLLAVGPHVGRSVACVGDVVSYGDVGAVGRPGCAGQRERRDRQRHRYEDPQGLALWGCAYGVFHVGAS